MKHVAVKPIVLCDCNNFFVSCERIYRPDLQKKPVIVLSSNDGCVVSRSNEAKALGIPMGVPFFQAEKACRHYGIAVFSSNFELYQDISSRVMAVMKDNVPTVEVYSIDEAFLTFDLSSYAHIEEKMAQIRKQVYQWVEIPVSIGAASSKTLTKLAAEYGKKHEETGGCYSLLSLASEEMTNFLERVPVGNIWGIGKQLAVRLGKHRIRTARELRDVRDERIMKIIGMPGVKTAWELRGIPCIKIKEAETLQKTLQVSRSFGREIKDVDGIAAAITHFVSSAGIRLRQEKALAGAISVYITTNRFLTPYYSNSAKVLTPYPTNYTPQLIKLALLGLDRIYKPGYSYTKAGVTLEDLSSRSYMQRYLFAKDEGDDADKKQTLMDVVDAINENVGGKIISPAILHFNEGKEWAPRSNLKSPAYTTRWEDVPYIETAD